MYVKSLEFQNFFHISLTRQKILTLYDLEDSRIYDFLLSYGDVQCLPSVSGLQCFCVSGAGVAVVYVPLDYFCSGGDELFLSSLRQSLKGKYSFKEVIFLYQDRWVEKGTLVRRMLDAHMGKQETVFARNCEVREIPPETAAEFLDRHHLYGSLKSAFRYGLFRCRTTGKNETGMDATGVLVAVGVFSRGREIGGRMSYEWLRYASAAGCRISGGMGKILDFFTESRKKALSGTFDVMSYADLEWSEGDSYRKLGFSEEGSRSPVSFLCDPDTGSRIHESKIGRDNRFRTGDRRGKVLVRNLGSIRFVKVIGQ